MASRREDRCGARSRRSAPEFEPSPVHEADDLSLTSLGEAFIEVLRDDPRFRDVIADPFGDHGPAT